MVKIKTFIQNWKTTLMGLLPAIVGVLVMLGVIDLEKQQAVIDGAVVVIDSVDGVTNEVVGAVLAFTALIGLFAKDGDKTSEQLHLNDGPTPE